MQSMGKSTVDGRALMKQDTMHIHTQIALLLLLTQLPRRCTTLQIPTQITPSLTAHTAACCAQRWPGLREQLQ